jgi:hypothetical protein
MKSILTKFEFANEEVKLITNEKKQKRKINEKHQIDDTRSQNKYGQNYCK